MQRILTSFVIRGAILASLSVSAFTQAGSVTESRETKFSQRFMGMHVLSPNRHWPDIPIGGVRTSGVSWGAIETASGKYDWSGLDNWVAQAQAHGVDLTYVILNTPTWASTRPRQRCTRGPLGCAAPPKLPAWEEFITALSKRYRGKIANYELWNEPNAEGYWTGSPGEMAKLASIAYPIIKANDPGATVLSPSPSSTGWPTTYDSWLDAYFSSSGGRYADVIAWHGYCGRSNAPTLAPELLVEQISNVRRVMAKHGLEHLPLWNTEGGWGKNSQLPNLDDQAAFIARWYLLQFTHGVARAFWYQWDNPDWGTLWRPDRGDSSAATAYAQVVAWLTSVTSSTPCSEDPKHTWTCTLKAGKKSYRIAWDASGPPSSGSLVVAPSARPTAGDSRFPADGPPPLGPKPVLLNFE
jgi:putative glycosyl hydrolase